jgi:hypothetical protein
MNTSTKQNESYVTHYLNAMRRRIEINRQHAQEQWLETTGTLIKQ